MDIWRWVAETQIELFESGQYRLAQLVEGLSHAVCDGRHSQVDSIVPEALALARAIKNPWLEVFIRHWYMQSKVFHRYEVADALPEAVRLLEFANREETRQCPQSVCVTQDLAQCYAQLDGPGYVEERRGVAGETLDRIDPSWPCFRCISAEYAGALCDERTLRRRPGLHRLGPAKDAGLRQRQGRVVIWRNLRQRASGPRPPRRGPGGGRALGRDPLG